LTDNSETYKSIKASPQNTTLDLVYISGTKGSTHSVRRKNKTRFPQEKWYGRTFKDWALKCLESKCFFRGIDCWDEEGEPITRVKDLKPRWSKLAMKRALSIIIAWSEVNETEKAHFVTLTVQHDLTGSFRSMSQAVADLRAGWEGIRKFVNRKGWKYLRVMEYGEEQRGSSGNLHPHYHMIIIGASDSEINDMIGLWIRRLNKIGNKADMKAQNVQYVDDIRNTQAYVSKYLSKSFEDNSKDERFWRWMELCYREGIRTFAVDTESAKAIEKKMYWLPKMPGEAIIKGETEIVETVDTFEN